MLDWVWKFADFTFEASLFDLENRGFFVFANFVTEKFALHENPVSQALLMDVFSRALASAQKYEVVVSS